MKHALEGMLGLVAAIVVPGCEDAGARGEGPMLAGEATTGTTSGGSSSPCAGGSSGAGIDGTTGESPADTGADTGEPPAQTLRVMSFNIRHGAESSLEEVAAVIRAESPDIVTLQEVDKEARRSDLVFQSYRLGQLTGMASLFRNSLVFPEGGEYGLAILSRFPLPSSQKVNLTSGTEQRVLVIVDVQIDDDHLLPIAITHMGLTETEREQQATEIVAALDGRPLAMLMGDFNAEPDAVAIETLTAAFTDAWAVSGVGDGFTFPAGVPDRRIDYLMLDESWGAPLELHVPVTMASDHRPLVATLPWPE